MYCIMSAKRTSKYAVTAAKSSHTSRHVNVQPTAPAGPVYEDVSPVPKEQIELKSNQAYGPIRQD